MGIEYLIKTNVPEGQECYEAAAELVDASGAAQSPAERVDVRRHARIIQSLRGVERIEETAGGFRRRKIRRDASESAAESRVCLRVEVARDRFARSVDRRRRTVRRDGDDAGVDVGAARPFFQH